MFDRTVLIGHYIKITFKTHALKNFAILLVQQNSLYKAKLWRPLELHTISDACCPKDGLSSQILCQDEVLVLFERDGINCKIK